jgi:hypothetical protein
LRRLKQYLTALEKLPDWPSALVAWGRELTTLPVASKATDADTARFRKTRRFTAALCRLRDNALAGAVGGTRLNTLAADALLPLLAARAEAEGAQGKIYERFWFHWELGDVPARLARDLRELLPPENEKPPVICNGLFQGLLQLGAERG